MRILITGVHGFVGTNLVRALSKEHTIYGLDIINPQKDGVEKTFSWDDLGEEVQEVQGSRVQGSKVQEFIDKWAKVPGVLAWKMPGAGGGGYLACVVSDSDSFCKEHAEAIRLTIRRPGM